MDDLQPACVGDNGGPPVMGEGRATPSTATSGLSELSLLQQLSEPPMVPGSGSGVGEARPAGGVGGAALLSQAALQAALMASLAAQQASHMQYQQQLFGSQLRHHPLAAAAAAAAAAASSTRPGSILNYQHQQQQRDVLLAWSKLAAQSANAAHYASMHNHLQTTVSSSGVDMNRDESGPAAGDTTSGRMGGNGGGSGSNSRLDDSGIQTSPKVDSTSNGNLTGNGNSNTLLSYGHGVRRHDNSVGGTTVGSAGSSGGDGTPSPTTSASPPIGILTSSALIPTPVSTRGRSNGKDGQREKVFVCQVCNRSFGYKHVLQNHERTHTGEKPFECKECHKRFTRDHHLKTHMRLHTGEKPYHCSHCDRQFVQVANLRRHLRVHTGERPYACELCDSKFSDSNQLKAHMLIHKGEKPFRCEQCFGTFRRRHHLMHHRCTREPSHATLMSGLLGATDEDAELDSEDRSDASSGDRIKTMSAEIGSSGLGDDISPTHSIVLHHNNEFLARTNGDLMVGEGSVGIDYGHDLRRRERKQKETRRVVRAIEINNAVSTSTCFPEQTEPEDLSLHAARRTSTPTPIGYKKNAAMVAEFAPPGANATHAIFSTPQA